VSVASRPSTRVSKLPVTQLGVFARGAFPRSTPCVCALRSFLPGRVFPDRTTRRHGLAGPPPNWVGWAERVATGVVRAKERRKYLLHFRLPFGPRALADRAQNWVAMEESGHGSPKHRYGVRSVSAGREWWVQIHVRGPTRHTIFLSGRVPWWTMRGMKLKRSGDRGWGTMVKWLSGLSLCVSL